MINLQLLPSCWNVKGFNSALTNWSIIEFVDSFRFGLFKLVIVVHFDFWFSFFYRFSIFQGYHYVGGRGVLKVETNKGSPKDNRPL